ncbi:MAG: hypothetical protein MZV70_65475 [Desulfobacterales bacterium]|nr:hypothetical protein [Desulfobacterales bacterium]
MLLNKVLKAMTYNFDPDRWYENERAALEERPPVGRLERGRLRGRPGKSGPAA